MILSPVVESVSPPMSPLSDSEDRRMSSENDEKPISQTVTSLVNLQFTLALAVPVESPLTNESPIPQSNTQSSGRTSESLKVQGYYRVEYSLIPGEANVGFDIVIYRTGAKIYPDNQDSQVVLTWEDQHENVWVVWNHTHKLNLTRERLLKLLSHKIFVKVWDGKEYCTIRTKLDKPRIARTIQNLISNTREENLPKTIIQNMIQNYVDKWVPRPLLYKIRRRLPIDIPAPSAALQKKINDTDSPQIPTTSPSNVLQEKLIGNLPGENILSQNTTTGSPSEDASATATKKTPEETTKKSEENARQRRARLHKHHDEKKEKGAAQIVVPSNLIFAGFKVITCRVDDDASLPKTIQDCFVSIKIEGHELLTETIANEFNPLSITILNVENMPSTPVSYAELIQRCEPVYCSYHLFGQPIHQTSKKMHANTIYWNDLHVYLTSFVKENHLSDFRNSPLLNIEIHDRDEREDSRRRIGSVFGTENADENIGRVTGKTNLIKLKRDSTVHPYGCVKVDLSELWLGQTSLEFYIPVVPCHSAEMGAGRSIGGKRTYTNDNTLIQQGDFLSAGTQMKILVRLAKPFIPPITPGMPNSRLLPVEAIPPFARIVFVFAYDNTNFLTALESSIRSINAAALGFDKHPAHIQAAALSTYKLTEAQQKSYTLNIITGFHLFDDEQHLFILEGRQEDAIDLLYKQLPKSDGKKVEILYDSSVHFNERLYAKLGVDLTHIRLGRTLRDIVSQPLIFVRDFLVKETFDALDKLHQLVLVHTLSSSARHNLFPTIDMITSLTRDFGVPLTEKEIILLSTDNRSQSASTANQKRSSSHADNYQSNAQTQQGQILSPDEVRRPEVNFLARNVQRVRLASRRNRENRKEDDSLYFTTSGPIFPYSTQRLNATENALEQMRSYLKKNFHSSTYSFNPQHRSGTFSPYSNDEGVLDYHRTLRSPLDSQSMTKEKHTDKATPDWVTYIGHRSSHQSNVHPKQPDPARLDELSKPPDDWLERSSLGRISPIGTSREPFKWTDRKCDFDTWTRVPASSYQPSALMQTTNNANEALASSTPSIVVSNERMQFLRRSTQTEMTISGRYSNTQLDRLSGLLKDKPVKKGLLLPRSYTRQDGAHSAPLTHKRSRTNTPDRRVRSTTTMGSRRYPK